MTYDRLDLLEIFVKIVEAENTVDDKIIASVRQILQNERDILISDFTWNRDVKAAKESKKNARKSAKIWKHYGHLAAFKNRTAPVDNTDYNILNSKQPDIYNIRIDDDFWGVIIDMGFDSYRMPTNSK